MAGIIDLLPENKTQAAILGTATFLFTASFAFVARHEMQHMEREAVVRSLVTTIEEQKAELDRLSRLIKVHDQSLDWSRALRDQNDTLAERDLLPQNLGVTANKLIEADLAVRSSLAEKRSTMANAYIESPPLKEIQAKLLVDFDQTEAFLAERDALLARVALGDPTPIDLSALKEHTKRYGDEANARSLAIDVIADKAVRLHNDEVAEANATLAALRFESNLAIAAWIYMGAYTGGLAAWLYSRRKRWRAHGPDAELK